MTKLILSK